MHKSNLRYNMKAVTILYILAIFTSVSFAQEHTSQKEQKKQQQEAEFKAMLEFVEKGDISFRAEKAYPRKGGFVDMTSRSNTLKIEGDSAMAQLAYFGKAYNVAYSENAGGIHFDGPIDEINILVNEKKQTITVSFKARNASDNFDCSLTISRSGNASLIINSRQREPASYSGRIVTSD